LRSLFACCAALLTIVLIVASVGGQGTIPRLASTYIGTIRNTTHNVQTTLALTSIVENQGNISGQVIIGPGLGGSGSFTGTMNKDGSVSFEVNSIFFKGSLRPDGSFGGTYSAPSANNQGGTWQTTAATQADGERPPGSEAIPVDQRFLGTFTGKTVTTRFKEGSMSINIEPGGRGGQVRVLMTAWDGPGKSKNLTGEISAKGQLHASGEFEYCTLVGGCSTWKQCELTGVINGNRLTGNFKLTGGAGPGTVISMQELQLGQRPPSDNQEGHFHLEK
jgi:hypothetical protein